MFKIRHIFPQGTASHGVSEESQGSKSGHFFVRWLPWIRSGDAKVEEKGGTEEKEDCVVNNAASFGIKSYEEKSPVGNVEKMENISKETVKISVGDHSKLNGSRKVGNLS